MIPPEILPWRKKALAAVLFFQGYHKPLDYFCNSFLPACVVLNHGLSNRSKQEMQNWSHKVSEERVRKLHWNISKGTTETNFPGLGSQLDAMINLFHLQLWNWIFWKRSFQVIGEQLFRRLITIPRSDYPQKLGTKVTATNLCGNLFPAHTKLWAGKSWREEKS